MTPNRWLGNFRPRRSSQPAFTLIELLVVIAIIALLISMLLPSLEAARRQSKQAACLANIKNIATSSRVYQADDRSGWGIPTHTLQFAQCGEDDLSDLCTTPIYIGAYEWGGKSGIGQDDFLTGSGGDPLNSKYGTKAGFGPFTRPMNDILYAGGFPDAFGSGRFDRRTAEQDTRRELDLFKCPGDDGPPRGAHCADWVSNTDRTSYDQFGTSYAANVFMIWAPGGTLGPGFAGNEMGSNSPYMRPTSRVTTPARTLFYEENIGRWAWSVWTEQCDFIDGIDPGPTKVLKGWHGRDWTYNRAFVDAHAETQKIYIEGTEDDRGYARHYRSELIYGNGNPEQQRHRCVIVRGDGWQKDTLPAQFIRTGLIRSGGGRASYEDCVVNQAPD